MKKTALAFIFYVNFQIVIVLEISNYNEIIFVEKQMHKNCFEWLDSDK